MSKNYYRDAQEYVNNQDEKGYECFETKAPNTYKCSACQYYKYPEAFHPNKDRSTNLKSFCKVCDVIDATNRYYNKKDKN